MKKSVLFVLFALISVAGFPPACQCHNLSRSAAYRRFRPYRHGRQQSHDEKQFAEIPCRGTGTERPDARLAWL